MEHVVDLQDTTTIHMTLNWAIREFDRSKLVSWVSSVLQGDGLDVMTTSKLIRPIGIKTMVLEHRQPLVTEYWSRHKIPSVLSTGFSTVSAINTQTVGITQRVFGVCYRCLRGLGLRFRVVSENNVFEPPICISTIN